jgi:sec-independent protein translocase protein TatA
MNLGPVEIGLIILAVMLLFGYRKLPDASRSLGRSLRIFKGEMKGMKDDSPLTASPIVAKVGDGDYSDAGEDWEAEARAADIRAAEARARAEAARASIPDATR